MTNAALGCTGCDYHCLVWSQLNVVSQCLCRDMGMENEKERIAFMPQLVQAELVGRGKSIGSLPILTTP